jgi:hypothetical protein
LKTGHILRAPQFVWDETKPQSLFHYTTARGLLGIITESALRATDLRFLNDSQEILYAKESFAGALAGMDNPAPQPGHDERASQEVFDAYKGLVVAELGSSPFPVYVVCFCESGDLLSQWRAYGSDHGYAVEFDSAAVQAALGEIQGSASLMQVHYGPEAAASVVSASVKEAGSDTNLGHYGVHAHFMAVRLTGMVAGIKHPGFSEEREWRLIVASEYEDRSRVRFRASTIAIVPYISIPFPLGAVRSIRIGPGPDVEVRVSGVERLLHAVQCDASVSSSQVPLRT